MFFSTLVLSEFSVLSAFPTVIPTVSLSLSDAFLDLRQLTEVPWRGAWSSWDGNRTIMY